MTSLSFLQIFFQQQYHQNAEENILFFYQPKAVQEFSELNYIISC